MKRPITKLVIGLWLAFFTLAFTSPAAASEKNEVVKAAKKIATHKSGH